ncbi:hypothetical protein V5O48_005247, partial [Marasmius crinis-equi]
TPGKASDSSGGPIKATIILGCVSGVLLLTVLSGMFLLLRRRRRKRFRKPDSGSLENAEGDPWSVSPYPPPGDIFVTKKRLKEIHEESSNEVQCSNSRGPHAQHTDENSETRTSSSARLQSSILRELRELRELLRSRRARRADIEWGSSGGSGTASHSESPAGTMPPPYSEAM